MINCHKLVEAKKLLGKTFDQKKPIVLSDPFRNQGQQMVVGTTQAPLQVGNQNTPQQGANTFKVPHVYTVTLEDVSI